MFLLSSLGIPPKLTSNFLCVSFQVLGQIDDPFQTLASFPEQLVLQPT